MIAIVCPCCHRPLQIGPQFAGQSVRCSICGGIFVVPTNLPVSSEPAGDSRFALGVAIIGGHLIALLPLTLLLGFGWAITVVLLGVLLEVCIWRGLQQSKDIGEPQRSPLDHSVGQTEHGDSSDGCTAPAPQTGRTAMTAPRNAALQTQRVNTSQDEPVSIQVAQPSGRGNERIPPPPRHAPTLEPILRRIFGDSSLRGNLPRTGVMFFGPGATLDVGRDVMTSPLVYATADNRHNFFDASLIDGTLPVAPPHPSVTERLPYWPSYYQCSPQQRSRYLGWLIGGRSDPETELGYVFIYFYGLERRVILDGADHLPIAEEIIRLFRIYRHSNSFRNYGSALLWLTIFLAGQRQVVPNDLLARAIEVTERWSEDTLGLCLAHVCQRGVPLPAGLAYVIAQNDPRSRSSVIVRRHEQKFRELFVKKYRAIYSEGLVVRSSTRPQRIPYRPASGTLLRMADGRHGLGLPTMPNVLAITSQFKGLLEVWESCVEDLRAFDRVRRGDGEEMSSEAYEALPQELREGEHPELNAWLAIWRECADDEGWPLVPVSRLAQLKGIDPRERLTKAQCSRILTTGDILGIGVEPDARMTGRPYRWNECVALFFSEPNESENAAVYNAAAVLLRLGLSIAQADGHSSQEELNHIARHLEGHFELSPGQTQRLERLQYLLLHGERADETVSESLRKHLSHDHRRLVGEFLVGIAAADQIITAGELRALKGAYRALGLDTEELDRLLLLHRIDAAGIAVPPVEPCQEQTFQLDMDAISRIMDETRQVSAILTEAMAVDDEEEQASRFATQSTATTAVLDADFEQQTITPLERLQAAPAEATSAMPFDGLDGRYQPFLREALTRLEWPPEDLKTLARQHNVMLNGAIEAINEWSCDRYGDWLIQEGNPIVIRLQLIKESS